MNSNNIFFTVHQIDGIITQKLVSKIAISSGDINFNSHWNHPAPDNKLNLSYHYLQPEDLVAKIVKITEVEDLKKSQNEIPNIPVMIRCQNCKIDFSTKYLYEQHQCEFDVDKVMLKVYAKGMHTKYYCNTCDKPYFSEYYFKKHISSHDDTQKNVCEHCYSQFMNENRLQIHKMKYCEKARHISKYCSISKAAWKCIKCNQIFATPASANKHAENCIEKMEIVVNKTSDNTKTDLVAPNFEIVLAKLVLQCEYCNTFYSDANLLVAHQKNHTTEVNYECVKCETTFDSYTSAVKHWTTKCLDEDNLLKMIYCEYCNQIFETHEILYTHKINKKHYIAKLHILKDGNLSDETVKSESIETLKKFIPNALTVDVMNNGDQEIHNKKNKNFKKTQDDDDVIVEDTDSELEMVSQNLDNQEPEKKEKGCKRKRQEQVLDKGYKYQCEHCLSVFDNIFSLENHRNKKHVCYFYCEECRKVVCSAKALVLHSKKHQNSKQYLCEFCGKSFSYSFLFRQHMCIQGRKLFVCAYADCKEHYTVNSNLKDRIRTSPTEDTE